MTPIASHISAFLQQRLPVERGASENTCDSYAYSFQLLFLYAAQRFNIAPSALLFEQLDAPLVLDFLNYLETDRGNSPVSRNARLAAIKSFMRYMQYRLPSALEQIQRVLAIPAKKTDKRLIHHLTLEEMQAVLDAPDPTTRFGIRDRAMLQLCFSAGLRVSELVSLRLADLNLQPKPTILIHGKGRKERALPLWEQTTRTIRAWLTLRGQTLVPELFLNAQGEPMTRAGFEYILQKHVATASNRFPSLLQKRISPHVLRHTCAMMVLTATKDIRKVSLWLGHATIQTTEIYLRADATEKSETVEFDHTPKTADRSVSCHRQAIGFSSGLIIMRSQSTQKCPKSKPVEQQLRIKIGFAPASHKTLHLRSGAPSSVPQPHPQSLIVSVSTEGLLPSKGGPIDYLRSIKPGR